MWQAFLEVFLICKLLQEKFISSRFVVTPFNKFIKLSIIFCLLCNSLLKKPISSCRNLSKQYIDLFKRAFSIFLCYEAVEYHDDLKAQCLSECFLPQYFHFQNLCVSSQLFEGKMVHFAAMISHYLSFHTFDYCWYP